MILGVVGPVAGTTTAAQGTGTTSKIDFGVVPAFEIAGNWGVELWLKFGPGSTSGKRYQFRTHQLGGIQITISNQAGSVSAYERTATGGIASGNSASFPLPIDNKWHHYYFGRQTSSLSTFPIYIDGFLMSTGTTSTALAAYPSTNRGTDWSPVFTLANSPYPDSFIGMIAELAIYDRPLTEVEIKQRVASMRFNPGWRQHIMSPSNSAFLNSPRINPTSWQFNGNFYLTTGKTDPIGFSTARNETYMWDRITNTVTSKANYTWPFSEGRGAVSGGFGYRQGGRYTDGSGTLYDFFGRYNPTTNTWQNSLPTPASNEGQRTAHVMSAGTHPTHGVGIYMGLGNRNGSLYFWKETTQTWVTLAAASAGYWQAYQRGVVADDNKLYVFSGTTGQFTSYDPVTNTWSLKTSPGSARLHHNMISFRGLVWVLGGQTSGVENNTTIAYDPATNTWANKPDLAHRLYGAEVQVLGDRMYAWAGDYGSGTPPMQYLVNPPTALASTATGVGVVVVPRFLVASDLLGSGVMEVSGEAVVFREVPAPGAIDMGYHMPQWPDEEVGTFPAETNYPSMTKFPRNG
jgi:hypothetical protein